MLERINELKLLNEDPLTINSSVNIINKSNFELLNSSESLNLKQSSFLRSKTLTQMESSTNNNNNIKDKSLINILDLIEDDYLLKEKYNSYNKSLKLLNLRKKEFRFLENAISNFNSRLFSLAKIFTEGMHEMSKELLRIHELQLDKQISSLCKQLKKYNLFYLFSK